MTAISSSAVQFFSLQRLQNNEEHRANRFTIQLIAFRMFRRGLIVKRRVQRGGAIR